jgi:hypothetical protein
MNSDERTCTVLSVRSQPSASARGPDLPSRLSDEIAIRIGGRRPTATRTLHPSAVTTSGSQSLPLAPSTSNPLVSDSSSSEAACSKRRMRACACM